MSFTKDALGTTESVGGVSLFESLRSNQNASGSYSGLMSAGDKAKLDGIEEGANKYIHPNSGVVPGRYLFVVVDEQGHVTDATAAPNGTLAEHEITDVFIRDGTIHIAENSISPLTAESNLEATKIVGVISSSQLPNVLAEYGIEDVSLIDGTVRIGDNSITPLTADSPLSAKKVVGVLGLENIPRGAERTIVVADDNARFALTSDDVQKGDVVKVDSTSKMYIVLDTSKLDSEEGYMEYSNGYVLTPATASKLGGVIVPGNAGINLTDEGVISIKMGNGLELSGGAVTIKTGTGLEANSDGSIGIKMGNGLDVSAEGAITIKTGTGLEVSPDGTVDINQAEVKGDDVWTTNKYGNFVVLAKPTVNRDFYINAHGNLSIKNKEATANG